MEHGLPMENMIFDPLVVTVSGTQEHGREVIKTTRVLKQLNDPPFLTTCGLSNVSNSCPTEIRPILNRIYAILLAGAGMDLPIADTFDDGLMKIINIINKRDDSTPLNKLYLALYDASANDTLEEFDFSIIDQNDPDQLAVMKTVKVLLNQTLYAHGYLNL